MQYLTNTFNILQTKTEHYWPQKGPFWAIGAKQPAEQPKGHVLEN